MASLNPHFQLLGAQLYILGWFRESPLILRSRKRNSDQSSETLNLKSQLERSGFKPLTQDIEGRQNCQNEVK